MSRKVNESGPPGNQGFFSFAKKWSSLHLPSFPKTIPPFPFPQEGLHPQEQIAARCVKQYLHLGDLKLSTQSIKDTLLCPQT